MVFQNPFDTLNPSHSVGAQIVRTLEKFHVGNNPAERHQKMLELLDLVKLPRAFAVRKPRQLSGGQKQRIGVARAFAGAAKVVVADEPVSALDVSVQAAVTELLMDIQRENKTTMLFISHDLSVVRYIADRVVVMYLGYIVEQGTTDQIFSPPYHPYTEALLSAIPIADTSVVKKHVVLEGDIPSAMNPPTGCPFQTRCSYKHLVPDGKCEKEVPPVKDLGDGHKSLCWLSDDVLAGMEPVIKFDTAHAVEEGEPQDAPRRKERRSAKGDPGFAGPPPKRPRGKTGSVAADEAEFVAEEGEEARRVRREEARDDTGGQGAGVRPSGASASVPLSQHQAGDGRQTVDPDARTAFDKGRAPSRRARAAGAVTAAARAVPAKRAAPTAAKKPAAASTASVGKRPPRMAKPKKPDDLKLISGVGPKFETILNGLGIYRFSQVAAWKKAERDWVDDHLNFSGRIERDDWVKQAKALAKGGEAEYIRVFGKKPR
jgi:peptide/nickel transport system ATP-binding protein